VATPRLQKLLLTLLAICCFSTTTVSVQEKPLNVFILVGQFNMEGQGSMEHDYNEGKGNSAWAMANSNNAAKMDKLKGGKGNTSSDMIWASLANMNR
jgi:hypothetical protein